MAAAAAVATRTYHEQAPEPADAAALLAAVAAEARTTTGNTLC
jgi:hypothetical protein